MVISLTTNPNKTKSSVVPPCKIGQPFYWAFLPKKIAQRNKLFCFDQGYDCFWSIWSLEALCDPPWCGKSLVPEIFPIGALKSQKNAYFAAILLIQYSFDRQKWRHYWKERNFSCQSQEKKYKIWEKLTVLEHFECFASLDNNSNTVCPLKKGRLLFCCSR